MRRLLTFGIVVCLSGPAFAQKDVSPTARGDALLAEYFRRETAKIERASLADVKTLKQWEQRRKIARKQLFEMLSLDPLPKRTPLKPVVTGRLDHGDFTVENLYFQSRPGLYVTANLYLPKNKVAFRSAKGRGRAFAERKTTKYPAILYVCGHGRVKKNGISYGNKTHYQHHGEWFARNGYVCLTIDTLQLGEIEGIHHGTYNHNMWWWNARGYTSAGVEAWNCIRALDYLQSRPEVDGDRIGVTGRSGGGAYSWWIAALDERIKVAVPVAGITSLRNHVIDGCVEGHCDCMYPVNTYRWDFAEVASLVAPRPLLISNSDKDRIFPLDGVMDVYVKTRRIYNLYKKPGNLGLQITEGPHRDTQELRIHAFHWFNRFLKNDPRYARGKQPLIEMAAVPFYKPEQLKVFDKLPVDEKNTHIQDTFVPLAKPALPTKKADWERAQQRWMKALREKCFRGWPKSPDLAPGDSPGAKLRFAVERHGIRFAAYDFTSQQPYRLRLYVAHRAGLKPSDLSLVVLNALDQQGWNEFLASMRVGFENELKGETLPAADKRAFDQTQKMFRSFKWGMAYVAPRGVGPTEWNRNSRKRTQIRRRFMLLGQTRDGMRVYDVVRAADALRGVSSFASVPLWMQGEREMAGITLYASLFTKHVARLDLWNLSKSHKTGPIFLNVLRFLDVPQAVAMAANRSKVRLYQADKTGWDFPRETAKRFGKKNALQVRVVPAKKKTAAANPAHRKPVMFRANPRHTAFYDTKGVKTLHGVKWKFKAGSGISSAPAVVNGTVYFGNWKGVLFALDEKTGQEKWRFTAAKNQNYFLNPMQSPAVAEGTVFIPAFDGNLYAVDAKTGRLKWKFQVKKPARGIAGAPTIVGDNVYFVSHAGRFYAVDRESGEGTGSFAAGKLVKSSPTIAGGLAVFSCYDNHLHAVDIKTGKEKWKAAGFAKAHLHPAIVDGVVYAGSGLAYRGKRKGFFALDLKTGKDLWSVEGGGASPAIAYGSAFLASHDGLYCYDLKARKQKWVFKEVRGNYVYMSPGVADVTVYATAGNTIYAVDVQTGKQRWKFAAESRILPTPVIANGTVYVATTRGFLYALH